MLALRRAAPVAALCFSLAACGRAGDPVPVPAGPSSLTAASGACGPVELPPVQGGEHLIGDQEPPVAYSSTPPTSGWHSSGAFEIGVFGEDAPLSEPQQVSVLEVGGAVATYRDLPDADRAALEGLATGEYAGRLAVTPYDALEPGQVALTAWGTLKICDRLDLDTVAAFVDAYADEAPEVPGAR
jgi:predicted small lipoprotein YifL